MLSQKFSKQSIYMGVSRVLVCACNTDSLRVLGVAVLPRGKLTV